MAKKTQKTLEMNQFLLKVGTHVEANYDEDGNKIRMLNEEGRVIGTERTVYKHNDPERCIVTSPYDLVKLHGRQKFEVVHSSGKPLEVTNPELRVLDIMTVKELKRYADDNEIDVAGMNRKADIVDTIKAAIAG